MFSLILDDVSQANATLNEVNIIFTRLSGADTSKTAFKHA